MNDYLAKMSNGDKAVAGGSLVVLIALFLPWYGWDAGILGSFSISGFNSWGWLTFLGLLAIGVWYVLRNFMTDSVQLPDLPFTNAQAYMIGGAVELLGVVLFWLVSHTGGLDVGNLGVRYGLFVALVGAVATIAGGYLKQSEPETAPSAAPPPSTSYGSAPPPPPAAPPTV